MTASVTMNPSEVMNLLYVAGVVADLDFRGRKVEGVAKGLCPVRTGRLRDSIQTIAGVDDKGPYCNVGSYTPYALFVELGTRRMSGTAFLRPAINGASDLSGVGNRFVPNLSFSGGGSFS